MIKVFCMRLIILFINNYISSCQYTNKQFCAKILVKIIQMSLWLPELKKIEILEKKIDVIWVTPYLNGALCLKCLLYRINPWKHKICDNLHVEFCWKLVHKIWINSNGIDHKYAIISDFEVYIFFYVLLN